jgi:hypothetical protein
VPATHIAVPDAVDRDSHGATAAQDASDMTTDRLNAYWSGSAANFQGVPKWVLFDTSHSPRVLDTDRGCGTGRVPFCQSSGMNDESATTVLSHCPCRRIGPKPFAVQLWRRMIHVCATGLRKRLDSRCRYPSFQDRDPSFLFCWCRCVHAESQWANSPGCNRVAGILLTTLC